MMLTVKVFQPFPGNVRIDLRCREVAVPEQQLDDTKICAAIQQMGCECVAETVR